MAGMGRGSWAVAILAQAAPFPAGLDPEPIRPLPMGFWIALGSFLAVLVLGLAWRRGRSGGLVLVPSDLGPYRILRPLGHGGFATTYLARQRRTGRLAALKVLHPHRLQDPAFRARFRQEARLGARLAHPNLVRLLDPGPEDSCWIALEYAPGPTLEARLLEGGRLPLDEAVAIALCLARALAHAHAHGVVHRDLKPANVILGPSGPKVMDLGIARELDSPGLTTTCAFIGTPLYAAPEAQLEGRVGPAADRYSLGVVLFEMLAGHPPFRGGTPWAILDRHRSSPAPDLGTLRVMPPPLARLGQRLLDKEPAQRPEDGELVARLQDLARGAGRVDGPA